MKAIMTEQGLLIPKEELERWGEVVVEEKPYLLIIRPKSVTQLILQRRLVALRLLAPHDRRFDVRPAPVMSCGASKRDRQTRRCNIRSEARV